MYAVHGLPGHPTHVPPVYMPDVHETLLVLRRSKGLLGFEENPERTWRTTPRTNTRLSASERASRRCVTAYMWHCRLRLGAYVSPAPNAASLGSCSRHTAAFTEKQQPQNNDSHTHASKEENYKDINQGLGLISGFGVAKGEQTPRACARRAARPRTAARRGGSRAAGRGRRRARSRCAAARARRACSAR